MMKLEINAECFFDFLIQNGYQNFLEPIRKAYLFAESAHQGQYRHSGEPYITHPLHVAYILSQLHIDHHCIIAGLLHDVVEDTTITIQDLEQTFGTETSKLVDGVTKLQKYRFHTNHNRQGNQAENYRKLLLSITEDARIILIKLADRLHNMQTIDYKEDEARFRIARETMDIYVPLANRFGLVRLQNEMEDLCLKVLDYEEYKNIASFLNETKTERDHYIQQIIPLLEDDFKKNHLDTRIYGRIKHIYSIYRKRLVRKVPYSEIYDFMGIRILTHSIDDCYFTLARIHSLFDHSERRFKDYIVRPKPNGYQSLHTIVIGPENKKIEFQIRTYQMHQIAEEGIAAHWRYKQSFSKDSPEPEKQLNERFDWIKNLLKTQTNSPEDFIELLKLNLQPDYLIVVTPEEDYIKVPRDSTPLDFAFAIHTEVGFHCIGAKINGRHAALKTTLKDGDVVEIITSTEANPGKDWLKILKSAKAKQKLIQWFRKKEREDAIKLGQEIFEKRCRKLHWKYKTDEEITGLARIVKINDKSTLYYLLGSGRLLFSQLKKAVYEKDTIYSENQTKEDSIESTAQDFINITLEDIHNLMFSKASCCNPLPGDQVIGYITRGRGISVHRTDCRNKSFINLCEAEPERIVRLKWETKDPVNQPFMIVHLSITAKNRNRITFDIMGVFARYQINYLEQKRKIIDNIIHLDYRASFTNSAEFDKAVSFLKKIPGIEKIDKRN